MVGWLGRWDGLDGSCIDAGDVLCWTVLVRLWEPTRADDWPRQRQPRRLLQRVLAMPLMVPLSTATTASLVLVEIARRLRHTGCVRAHTPTMVSEVHVVILVRYKSCTTVGQAGRQAGRQARRMVVGRAHTHALCILMFLFWFCLVFCFLALFCFFFCFVCLFRLCFLVRRSFTLTSLVVCLDERTCPLGARAGRACFTARRCSGRGRR